MLRSIYCLLLLLGILSSASGQQTRPAVVDTTFHHGKGHSYLQQNGVGFGANDGVYALAEQPDNKLLIAGDFTEYNGVGRQRIARLHANGTLDTTFKPALGANATIFALALQADGKVLIAGAFTSYNGTARNRIARINVDGTLDTAFDPGTAANDTIKALLLLADGKVLIGGYFTSYNGTARNRIARLNTNGSLDTAFDPGTAANGKIEAIVLESGGKPILGGGFTSYNGTTRNRIARLNANGSLDTGFDPGIGPNKSVYCLAIQPDGKLLAGGNFNHYNNVSSVYLVRLNTNGTRDNTFSAPTSFSSLSTNKGTWLEFYSMLLQPDGKVLVGGTFAYYTSGSSKSHFLLLDSEGRLEEDFYYENLKGQINGEIGIRRVIALTNGKLLISGRFTDYSKKISRSCILRIHPNGEPDFSFNPSRGLGYSGFMGAITSSGKIVVCGDFSTYNDSLVGFLVGLNLDGSLDEEFDTGSGPNSVVNRVLVQPDGKLIISGIFSSYNGTEREGLARLHSNGSLDNNFVSSPLSQFGDIYDMALQSDGKLIIVGDFTSYGGTTRNRIARLHTDGTLDTSFDPGIGPNDEIHGVSLHTEGKIIIVGDFTSVGGVPRHHIARLNSDGTLDTDFNSGAGANAPIYRILIENNGKILGA